MKQYYSHFDSVQSIEKILSVPQNITIQINPFHAVVLQRMVKNV